MNICEVALAPGPFLDTTVLSSSLKARLAVQCSVKHTKHDCYNY